ncbi:hypothetical protein SARC_01053 [Sphaeroforma arctica JP610]|uniref:Uncharacterized protein n=1 Tax=Sphaeroforma arctica JP610 TaxID=667725 RepID=A0A0L0GD56_9EUKA|nr:hypothetical protein SARC_01053 [Sphaeroforma arctica JP610]KNC86821.1 hypothetical protein SARC_01053 [Sphaeroforma arctica JP610]|eukprot:XP_014160723.1 hypothetical protein SARC_01053 [Sphaeroforma arctica JP610]
MDSEQMEREQDALGDHSGWSTVHFFKILESPALCRKTTGEPTMTVLRLLFDYLNYNNRLANLTQWNDKVHSRVVAAMELNMEGTDQDEEDYELRKRSKKLTVWEYFILFMLIFMDCRDNMAIAGMHFDISELTARRIYTTFCIALSHIFKSRQPFPTPLQAAPYTPDRTKQTLDLNDGIALFIGDCAERKIESPLCVSNDLYSASLANIKIVLPYDTML